MKTLIYSFLLFAGISVFSACSNGDYVANPNSNANGSINPLNPLNSDSYNWAGSGKNPMSANINGTPWVALGATYAFDSNTNVLIGTNGNTQLRLNLTGAWKNNTYNMGYKQYNYEGIWSDSMIAVSGAYQSVLGNSGGLYMLQNDSLGIKGLFYFQGIDSKGNIVNISNGYFNIQYYP